MTGLGGRLPGADPTGRERPPASQRSRVVTEPSAALMGSVQREVKEEAARLDAFFTG